MKFLGNFKREPQKLDFSRIFNTLFTVWGCLWILFEELSSIYAFRECVFDTPVNTNQKH